MVAVLLWNGQVRQLILEYDFRSKERFDAKKAQRKAIAKRLGWCGLRSRSFSAGCHMGCILDRHNP